MTGLRRAGRWVVVAAVLVGCGDDEAEDAGLFQDPDPPATSNVTPLDPTGGDTLGEGTVGSATTHVDSGPVDDTTMPEGSSSGTTQGVSATDTTDEGSSTTGPGEGSSSTGPGEGSSSSGEETGPPGMCDPVPPGMGACPPACTGGCAGGTCTITCAAGQCSGGGGGPTCPDGWPCVIDCTADNTCANTTITCGDSGCEIVCGGVNSCLNSTVNCGPQACSATCMGAAANLASFNCAACACENNGC